MEDNAFIIENWNEFSEKFASMVNNWEEEKRNLLNRIASILEEKIKPEIPVDTSTLAESFFPYVSVGGADDYASYSTNLEYALYVNDGHVQHSRAVPVKYLSAGGKKKGYRTVKGKHGKKYIILSERYIPGKHFIEKGSQNAKSKIQKTADNWMKSLFIKYGLK